MEFSAVVPVLRTFDTAKADEFYLSYLQMRVDWEHQFEPDLPLYRQVSRDGLVLHLTEHHGDSTPGAVVYVYVSDVTALHAELSSRSDIGHNRPGLGDGAGPLGFEVIDPFGNRLRFGQASKA